MPETPTEKSLARDKAKEEAKRAARAIPVIKYFKEYIAYKGKHLSNPMEWNRSKFLAHLQTVFGTTVLPDSATIAGKHNYAINTKIPAMRTKNPAVWGAMTDDVLAKLKLPPTGRSSAGAWEGTEGDELAEAMKELLGL